MFLLHCLHNGCSLFAKKSGELYHLFWGLGRSESRPKSYSDLKKRSYINMIKLIHSCLGSDDFKLLAERSLLPRVIWMKS